MIDWITNKLTVRFMERIATTRLIEENTKTTLDKNQDKQPGKRKQMQEPAPPIGAKEFFVDNISVHGPEDHPIYVICGGTQRFTWHRLKCFKCGHKGHVRRDFINEGVCFNCF